MQRKKVLIKAVSSSRLEVSFQYIKTELCRDSKGWKPRSTQSEHQGTMRPTAASGSRVPEAKHTHLQKANGH